jgi:hypothetical protein
MALKDRFETAGAWRLWSVRLAAVAGVLWTAFAFVLTYAPDTLIGVLNSLPPEMRAAFPPATGLILAGVAAAVRLWKQAHPEKKDG